MRVLDEAENGWQFVTNERATGWVNGRYLVEYIATVKPASDPDLHAESDLAHRFRSVGENDWNVIENPDPFSDERLILKGELKEGDGRIDIRAFCTVSLFQTPAIRLELVALRASGLRRPFKTKLELNEFIGEYMEYTRVQVRTARGKIRSSEFVIGDYPNEVTIVIGTDIFNPAELPILVGLEFIDARGSIEIPNNSVVSSFSSECDQQN